MEITDVAIVGAGPAGIAATIQLCRCGVEPIVFEKARVGGLVLNANLVENYPGFHRGISGVHLARLMETHLSRYEPNLLFEEVLRVEEEGDHFAVETRERAVRSRIAIIASGTKPRPLDTLDIPQEVRSKVLYEVYPIMMVRGRRIVIVGGGDAAFDYALTLGRHNEITILNRADTPRCLPVLWQRAGGTPTITYMSSLEIVDVEATQTGEMVLRCSSPKGTLRFTTDYLVLAIGRDPDRAFLSEGLSVRIEQGQPPRGLHLVGDVRTGSMRQTAIAVGDGVMAAIRTQEMLKEIAR